MNHTSREVVGAAWLLTSMAAIGCVVTTGPAPSAPPATATPAAAVPPPPAPAPAQPPFQPSAEPTERPAEHPHGIARGKSPEMHPGHVETLWIWHDDNGANWHVRSTTAGHQHRFSGRLWTSEGSLADVRPTRLEWSDRVRLEGRSVEFDFHTQGGIDGFDFRTAGARCVHFAMSVDGKGEPGLVRIGASGVHPSQRVFTLCP
jgi:hypothetical protein